MLSKGKNLTLAVTPIITGSISFVASFTIIFSILRSNVKLSNSYRRLVFGISVYGLLLSISQTSSSVPMPVDTYSLASGNDTTCAIQTFVGSLGFSGTIFYSLSLTIYFLLVVKYDVCDTKITKHVEPFLHAIPIIYSSVFPICVLATKNYNVDVQTASCMIGSRPLNCYDDPEVDCISKGDPIILPLILGSSMIAIFTLNCIMMVMIYLAVYFQVQKSQTYRYSWMISSRTSEQENRNTTPTSDSTPCDISWKARFNNIIRLSFLSSMAGLTRNNSQEERRQHSSSILAARLSQPSQASIRRLKETSNRAIGYVVGFLLSYSFTFIRNAFERHSSIPAPFAIIFLSKFFFPLQGFFNVIVYTHPHVVSYRRNHSEHSLLRAFWEVVKSGGDSDRNQIFSGRRRSLGRQRKALASENLTKKNSGRRNLSNSFLGNEHKNNASLTPPSPSTAAQPLSQTVKSCTQGKKSNSMEPSTADTPKSLPIDVYSVCEEGSENKMGSSKLMKSDSSNWIISSNNSDYDDLYVDDDEDDDIFLNAPL